MTKRPDYSKPDGDDFMIMAWPMEVATYPYSNGGHKPAHSIDTII